ncbi:MAG: four helix bundle protein [Clostridia bacterium]|nr:four helix bundle protein [Clostridia bacterium]
MSFAVRIVKLYNFLTEAKREFVLSKQILRSGTSIGANLAESEYAISADEFSAKIYIALKECAETEYWLKLLRNTEYISTMQFDSIFSDCEELRKILASITKTLKEKKNGINNLTSIPNS